MIIYHIFKYYKETGEFKAFGHTPNREQADNILSELKKSDIPAEYEYKSEDGFTMVRRNYWMKKLYLKLKMIFKWIF